MSKPYPPFKFSNYWRVGIALAVSVLLHFVVFSGVDWHWPQSEAEESVIETRLVSLPAPRPPPRAKPATKIADNKLVDKTPSVKKAAPLEPPPVAPETTADAPPAPVPAASDEMASAEPDAATDSSPNAQSPEATVASEPPADMPKAPSHVDMDYELSRGSGGKIGNVHVVYSKEQDGSYQLRSESKAQGVAALFVSGALVQTSTGVVNEGGLQPAHFAYEFGTSSDKRQYADFDWVGKQLTMRTAKGDKTEALPAGTQDQLSFMYQYMFVPPLVHMQLAVTNGKKLSHYSYTFEGEETVSTKLGELHTLHIAKSGAGEEKTELWLATDYHYLPIKIRKTEKDGKLYEQIVTRLSTE